MALHIEVNVQIAVICGGKVGSKKRLFVFLLLKAEFSRFYILRSDSTLAFALCHVHAKDK